MGSQEVAPLFGGSSIRWVTLPHLHGFSSTPRPTLSSHTEPYRYNHFNLKYHTARGILTKHPTRSEYRISMCLILTTKGHRGHPYQLVILKTMPQSILHHYYDSPIGEHLGRLKPLMWNHVKSCQMCQTYKPFNTLPRGLL